MSVPKADFRLKLEVLDRLHDSGQIKQYNSLLTVVRTARRC